jgi:hypothetical protein
MIQIVVIYQKLIKIKILFRKKHQNVRTTLGFNTKTLIGLANPVTDFLHSRGLFKNTGKI